MLKYKIKDIESLTGIKAHTLRVWEKRYNLFQPERTDTQIRTYSTKDLKKILNISVLYQNGWKISKIAKLSAEEISKNVMELSSTKEVSNAVVSLLIQALIDFDDTRFERVLNNTIAKEGLFHAYVNYILPFLKHIGVMWSVGAIEPAHEHFVSNIIRQKIIISIDQLEPVESKSIDYVLYCPEGEWHEIGLLFYYYRLKKQGKRVFYLGTSVPFDSVIKTIKLLNPKALVSSFVTSIEKERLDKHLVDLRKVFKQKIYVGGRCIDQYEFSKFNDVFHISALLSV